MRHDRGDDDRIDHPETADDFLLAAQAWATGKRSWCNIVEGDSFGQDAAQATALATVATAMLSAERRREGEG